MTTFKREITLRFLAKPSDINLGGNVHGGIIMKWIDEAAYSCASAWSGSYCVTAHMGDVSFITPVKVGQLVELHAKIIHTGNSSMHVAVGLNTQDLKQSDAWDVLRCVLIFVAVNDQGQAVKVPSWEPIKEEDLALQTYATELAKLKKKLNQDLSSLNFRNLIL